jgi:uncharacterized membrane protein YczE/cytidylate kinase
MEKLKRYIVFLIGLYINSLGVAMVTKANLGTSPISSIPYVLSLKFPLTLGQFTIAFSLLLIALQLVILRKNFKFEHALQIPVSIAFGYFIDFSMILLGFVNPANYLMKIIYLLIGCLILGFGVYMEVLANVVMLPGESFVRAVVLTWKTEFGTSKMIFDVSMTVIAGILSFVFMGHLQGVREGTVIAALLVGFIARTLGRILSFVPEKLYGTEDASESVELQNPKQQSICIAIGREYESGGHDYGKHLAEKLGYEFYDHSIIKMAAKELGFELGYAEKIDESMTSGILFDFANQVYGYSAQNEPPKDALFEEESKLIKKLAAKGNCVIVGRGCDYILKDHPKCLKVFLHAPFEYRTKRYAKKANLSLEEAQKQIHQNDRRRAENYHYYTRQIWGLSRNYDLCLDTSAGNEFLDLVITNALESMN